MHIQCLFLTISLKATDLVKMKSFGLETRHILYVWETFPRKVLPLPLLPSSPFLTAPPRDAGPPEVTETNLPEIFLGMLSGKV